MLKWTGPFDPDDTKDYTANWAAELTARDDTIASTIFTVDETTTGVTIVSTVIDATETKAIAWISAADKPKVEALVGQTVAIAHSITTAGGRVLNKTLGLKIKAL